MGIYQKKTLCETNIHFKQLSAEIRRIWKSPHEYAINLMESMFRRCQSIINTGSIINVMHFNYSIIL